MTVCVLFFFTLRHREISALLHFSSPLDKLHLPIEIWLQILSGQMYYTFLFVI